MPNISAAAYEEEAGGKTPLFRALTGDRSGDRRFSHARESA
jgi:hypothetical protein